MNFERMNQELRERVERRVDSLIDKVLEDHFIKGGTFDPKKFARMFMDCAKAAELVENLMIGTGLCPLKKVEEKDEVSDNRSGDSEGPTRGEGTTCRVCHSGSPRDETGDNGPTGVGKIDPDEFKPAPSKS